MQQKLKGLIIRRHRQEQNMPQKDLCKGICTVSYLSKIEQGKVECSSEVLHLLFARLNIQWHEDPDFCREEGDWIDDCYDRLFSGESMERQAEALAARETLYCASPFFLDWVLLTWAATDRKVIDVEAFASAMDLRQRGLYLCLELRFDELLQMSTRSYYLLEAGKHSYWKTDYSVAMAHLQQSMQHAAQEGSLPVMMYSALFLGNCYKSLNQVGQAYPYYTMANRMARSLGNVELQQATAYNIASTELQAGQVEQALQHLLRHPWEEGMYYQKLANCYERLGKKQEALQALDNAMAAPLMELSTDPVESRWILRQICDLIRYRLEHPAYIHDAAYGKLLVSFIEMAEEKLSGSFTRFYVSWLEEWCIANRQYRRAYEMLRKYYKSI